MPQSLTTLYYHLIFSTKDREPLLNEAVRLKLYPYVAGILRSRRSTLITAGGMPDHVHWLISLHQQFAVADAVRDIKANTSKWIHETRAELRGFAWQSGYGAFSVSFSRIEQVKAYIESQQEHHQTISYQEEYRRFLDRHGVSFDEKYLWD